MDFSQTALCDNYTPTCCLSARGVEAVDAKQVISPLSDPFISSIFTTEKPDGSHRTILNLKKLNESIRYVHFKMESLKNVIQLIRPGVWMGSIDLRDAYYSVRVDKDFQRYFTCYWKGCYYEFLRMPNGYAQAPLIFTKLLKQPFGFLREHGYSSVVYIDDSYLQGDTYAHCLENINATRTLLTSLGFSINHDKSVLQPTQCIVFLGFILDSIAMTISLTEKRKHTLLDMCTKLNVDDTHTIRSVGLWCSG